MKIAVVSTIEEMVPPPAYGGIERVVALLERGLVERGHDVVLLASGGSQPRSRLVALTDRPLRGVAAPTSLDGVAVKEEAARRAASALDAEGADVVLNHMWRLLDHVRPNGSPIVTTTHYPLDVDPYRSIFQARRGWPFVSISRSQQREGPTLRFVANIYNGVDVRSFGTGAGDGGYLAFLGRLSPDKGADVALRVARAAGLPLRIAARAEATDPWARDNVLPLVQAGYGELVGELPEAQKADFLGRATALLHPSRWSEPFGLAAVEALACGTPVIATRVGALPEIVRDGVTGFVADTEEELARAARRSPTLSRSACRRDAEARFDYRRMVDEYEALAEREASG